MHREGPGLRRYRAGQGARRLVALALLVAALVGAGPAGAADDRVLARFTQSPSAEEWAAIRKYAKTDLDKARAANRMVEPLVARMGGSVLVTLRSVALCDPRQGCPLMVFRQIDRKPVFAGMSFEDVLLVYRGDRTFLVPSGPGPRQECQVSGLPKARCRPAR